MSTNYVNNTQYVQPIPQTNEVAGVKIAIHQPSAGPNQPAPVYNPYAYPPNYYLMPPVYYVPQQPVANQPIAQQPVQQAPQPAAQQPIASQPMTKPAEQEEPTTGKKKTKVVTALTDDYIKSLENYLNSSDVEDRRSGVAELMQRFEEDPSRKNDLALNNLLNKALQDPSPKVKMIACLICESELAKGNAKTRELLTKISHEKDFCGQLADTAREGLLKLTHEDETIETNEVKKEKGNK